MASIPNINVPFSTLQSVLGGTNPIALSEYYSGAGKFSEGVMGIPSSGIINAGAFRGKSKPTSSLFTFSSFTFTNAGAQGASGPSLGQCQTAYSGQSWLASYFSCVNGYQSWTIPTTKSFTIQCCGAGSTIREGGTSGARGCGALLSFSTQLIQGRRLKFVVGQPGLNSSSASVGSGGCGATYIEYETGSNTNTYNILAVAGGGAGQSSSVPINTFHDASIDLSSPGNGQGGLYPDGTSEIVGHTGGTGAGYIGNGNIPSGYSSAGAGVSYTGSVASAQSYLNGSYGGTPDEEAPQAVGGFGGGGGSGGYGGGAAGGYTGGALTSVADEGQACGGTSYCVIAGATCVLQNTNGLYNGFLTIS